mmetsp:Transcript_15298/g.46627  ORF Transcript_15298/g.46627 Transcript_15298/m.46627 type:complete len:203 (-) Transcript_15298:3852-4460(-)|eukprot:scaffold11495_cov30-Tisochrysis_lutea.AAC.4
MATYGLDSPSASRPLRFLASLTNTVSVPLCLSRASGSTTPPDGREGSAGAGAGRVGLSCAFSDAIAAEETEMFLETMSGAGCGCLSLPASAFWGWRPTGSLVSLARWVACEAPFLRASTAELPKFMAEAPSELVEDGAGADLLPKSLSGLSFSCTKPRETDLLPPKRHAPRRRTARPAMRPNMTVVNFVGRQSPMNVNLVCE